MTLRSSWAGLAATIVLAVSMTACKDTKTLQENEQLKAKIADLQRENGQLGNNLETVTADRDALSKELTTLKAQAQSRRPKRAVKKSPRRKRRQA
jgi:esterase/lipase superfamily enzyme